MSAVVRDISPIRRRARSHEPTLPQMRNAVKNLIRVAEELEIPPAPPAWEGDTVPTFRADTKAGPYTFRIYGPKAGEPRKLSTSVWVAGRFEFPERARELGIDCNPYSGKWNHHFLTRGIIDDAHEEFRWQISRYLVQEPKNAISS